MKMKNALLYSIIGGLFLVPFIAFFVPGNMFFPFISGKGFVFRILIEILFGLYVMLCVMAPEYRPKLSWVTKSILLFAVAILVADLLGVNAYKSIWSNYERMEGFVLIFHLVLYYMTATGVLQTAKRWYQFFNISIGGSVLMSIYGVLQLTGKLAINQGGVRLDATFGNASYLAIYLVFHIFLSLYLLFRIETAKWLKWLYGLVAVFETCILYYTATRGAILGLIGGLVLAALIVAWKAREHLSSEGAKENKTLRKTAYGVLIAVVILIVGFIGIRNVSFVQKSPVLSRFASMGLGELQSQGRYYVWPMAVKGIIERPIFGWGQEGFNFVFNKNYDPRMWNQEQWFDRAHDIVLDWLIAGGIVGFLAYASMYVALLYCVWKKGSGMSVTEKSLLTGLIAAYVFNNIFVFDNLVSYILFFSVLGYVHTRAVSDFKPTGKFYEKTFSADNRNYVFTPIIAVVCLAGVYFINVPAILANTTLISAITPPTSIAELSNNLANFKKVFAYNSFGTSEALEQLVTFSAQVESSQQVSDTLKQQFYDLGNQQVQIKIERTPHDARYLVFAGDFYQDFGQYSTALTYLKQATVESPRKPSIYFDLGQAYVGLGDYASAFTAFQTGYELAPDSSDGQIIYAVGAIYDKNAEVLSQVLPQIATSTIYSDNRFLQAYAAIGDYQTVIAILNERLATDPTNAQYELSLASAYLQIGQKQKAIDLINQIIAQDPTFKTQGEQYIQQINNQQ
jgi:tetratricopeptide (TPR) repeat protein/O-antigen ligase